MSSTFNRRFTLRIFSFFVWSCSPPAGQGLLILDEVSRSNTTTHHSR